MDIIDIITTVIEFSQKDEEFSDEIKAVRATLESLHLTIQHVDQHDLPAHMIEILNEHLEEAGDLLKKVSSESTRSWWTSLKNMLPGSNLQKLKEKNQQLLHIINLLNLHLNALKSNKRVARVDLNDDEEEFEGSQPIKKVKLSSSCTRSDKSSVQNKNLSISTTSSNLTVNNETTCLEVKTFEASLKGQLQPEPKPKRPAFTLKLLCDKKIGEILSQGKEIEPVLTEYWDDNGQATYEFHRYNFPDLPSPELMKMSKDHAIITAMCCPKSEKQESANYQKLEKSNENDPRIANKSAQIVNEEGNEDKSSEYKYILKDQSLNGTYYLKNFNLEEVSLKGVEIKANFLHLKKGEQILLEHGDIIALVVQKPKCDELIFGFQFLTH